MAAYKISMRNLKSLKQQIITFALTLLMATSALAGVKYTTTGVNVRTGPWGRILTGVPAGTMVQTLSKKNGFYRVRFEDGRIGWIHSKYVSKNNPIAEGTEGSYCEGCLDPSISDPLTEASENIKKLALYGRGAACIASKIIDAAKSVIKSKYGNRTRGKGQCAKAVRQALNKASIWPGGGIGHAADMIPGLRQMGFENIIESGMTPASAPEGTILIYGRAKSSGCRGLGAIYGHVEIKESDSSYLYDGKVKYDIQKAYGARCRPLIGVMKMSNNCTTCTQSIKESCGV